MNKFIIQALFLALPVVYSYGQITKDDSLVLINEKYMDKLAKERPFYIESLSDSLSFNSERYYFRSTPLAIKEGYTSIIPEMYNIRAYLGPTIHKGYCLSWLVRKDSIYIVAIYPAFKGYYKAEDYAMKNLIYHVHPDTIIARLETFIGNSFKNGLLFVDWINGDFPAVKANPNPPETKTRLPWTLKNTDYLYPPLLICIENGVITGIKDDKKGIKDLKKN